MTYFLGPRLSGGPGPPILLITQLSPYYSYVTQLHFFSEFETSPPLKFTFCSEFTLFRKRVNCQAFFFRLKSFCTQLSPYDSYVTQLHFFSEFETSPPIKLTFCTEFALFRKRVNGQTLFFEAKSFCPRI